MATHKIKIAGNKYRSFRVICKIKSYCHCHLVEFETTPLVYRARSACRGAQPTLKETSPR
jgi:hypothetical protein